MKRFGQIKFTIYGLLLVIGVGCAGMAQEDALHKMHWHFSAALYGMCLDDIKRLHRNYEKLTPIDRARSSLNKAICMERLGNQEEADDVYKQIMVNFRDTTFATRAEARLYRREQDQKEHAVPVFDGREWYDSLPSFNLFSVTRKFSPAGSRLTRESIQVTSIDLSAKISFPEEECVAKFMAALRMHFPSATAQKIPSEKGNFLFSYDSGEVDKKIGGHGVARVIITETRMHMILYGIALERPFNAEQWLGRLEQVTIKDGMKAKGSKLPEEATVNI